MGRVVLLVVIVACALPVASGLAAKPPQPSGELTVLGTAVQYVAPSGGANGFVSVLVGKSKGSSAGLRGQTVMFTVTPETRISGDVVAGGDTVSVRAVSQQLGTGPRRLVATQLDDLGRNGTLPPISK